MAETRPDISVDMTLDMSSVEYVPGYDEPDADVVFVCSDKKAFRIHDYFLKADSPFFREMLQAETKGGPIGLPESSADLQFIFDRVTRKAFDGALPVGVDCVAYTSESELLRAIALEGIASKYMFETVTACLRRFVIRYAAQNPLRALAFASNLSTPDAIIAKAAFAEFTNEMGGHHLGRSFVLPSNYWHTPAPHNLKLSFVEEELGLRAYHAYVVAMQAGRKPKTENEWHWGRVASRFVAEMKMKEISVVF